MRFLDLFAGIGGFRFGLEKAGHNCVGFCEIDKYARTTYKANFDTEGEWEAHDIRSVTDKEIRRIGPIELICGGFPCQAFSVAGKRLGFDDTRGTLFFEICRFAKLLQPEILFLENVKGLLSHDNGRTFFTIIDTLGQLGYDVEHQVLNSKNFGVPQNRERVFIIGHLRNGSGRKVFPIGRANNQTVRQVIGGTQSNRVYDTGGISVTLSSQGGGQGAKTGLYLVDLLRQKPKDTSGVLCIGNVNPSGKGMNGQVFDSQGLAPTLTTNKGEGNKIAIPVLTPDRLNKRQNGRRFKEDGEPMFTLTGQDRHGVMIREATKKGYDIACEGGSINLEQPNSQTRRGRVGKGIANTLTCGGNQGTLSGMRIRKLTPLECFRLQGFPDEHWQRAKDAGVSDSQLYKQAGNSVTVNVIYEIAKRL